MLDLHRLRLLHELQRRGTIAAVADALRFTPSAVSQQLAVLEREAGVKLLERAGRGVRLTDAALVLAAHAGPLLERAERAEADLAGVAGLVAGRARVAAFQSAARRLAVPAFEALAREAPGLRCELVEGEPEPSLPALALGDLDLVLADEWQHQPRARPESLVRTDLLLDDVKVCLAADHPLAARAAVPIAELAGEAWCTGQGDGGWKDITLWTCRELGGFDPDLRHRANDSTIGLALIAAGQGVALFPDLVAPGSVPGVVARPIAEGRVRRTIYAATRAVDGERPSVRALIAAIAEAAAGVT